MEKVQRKQMNLYNFEQICPSCSNKSSLRHAVYPPRCLGQSCDAKKEKKAYQEMDDDQKDHDFKI